MPVETSHIVVELSKNWVDYLSAVLVPTVAVAGILVATLQWNTNRKRLKHELFDRRYAIFSVIKEFLGSIERSGRVSQEAERDFLIGTRGARFIFDKEIDDYLFKTIWPNAVGMQTYEAELEGVPVGDERSRLVRLRSEYRDKLHEEFKGLEEKFSSYMQLGH